ncbi:MAG: hypothetical protein OXI01_22635 [Albidovulum sp.]|nr:hypothetical protein [Albidovulum sp.]
MKFSMATQACALLSALVSPANADKISLPDLLEEIPGIGREGRLAGMDAWRNAATGEFWFLAPDGVSIVAGRVVGSPKTPVAPRESEETCSTFQFEGCNCRGEGRTGANASANSVSGSLLDSLNSATGDSFNRPLSIPGSGSGYVNRGNVGKESGEIRELSKIREKFRVSEDVGSKHDRFKLLEALRQRAFWFGVGREDAHPVYAIVDPACPYSAEAMLRLKEHVESGFLQLRIVLIATARRDSVDALASILSSPEPPAAFWQHSIAKARRGRSNLPFGDYAALPAGIRSAVRANSELARELEITGVPYFVPDASLGEFSYSERLAGNQFARTLDE